MAYRPDYESADYQEGYADGKAESVKEWQGLSDDEIDALNGSPMALEHSGLYKFAHAIEQALKEKNNAV